MLLMLMLNPVRVMILEGPRQTLFAKMYSIVWPTSPAVGSGQGDIKMAKAQPRQRVSWQIEAY